MKKIITLLMLAVSINSFASLPSDFEDYDKAAPIPNLEQILNKAEEDASVTGRKVLESARIMISNQEIVLGSCWDYIDALYNRAGFFENQRADIFRSKLQGPYVQVNLIEGGDWLYFVNHSYGDVEHSSVFVAWTNLEKKEALMISYSGGNNPVPARYKVYDLSSVYNIMRGK